MLLFYSFSNWVRWYCVRWLLVNRIKVSLENCNSITEGIRLESFLLLILSLKEICSGMEIAFSDQPKWSGEKRIVKEFSNYLSNSRLKEGRKEGRNLKGRKHDKTNSYVPHNVLFISLHFTYHRTIMIQIYIWGSKN